MYSINQKKKKNKTEATILETLAPIAIAQNVGENMMLYPPGSRGPRSPTEEID